MIQRTLPQTGAAPQYFVYLADESAHFLRNRLRNFCGIPSTLAPHAR